ncbi:FAD-binding protein [Sediminicoccus sp. KRV36]|uniref:FAD-binding protein n=1 Tax=Sediminicoccus sp. KRV36 TaxID=3133721 RepID=UPI00200F19C1|nr:FAD-binding protein [Sediminicoccus rosea]UPY37177.1 FAD-binding protein [Sediminicoccus rosea]
MTRPEGQGAEGLGELMGAGSIAPATEESLAAEITRAHAAREPLCIEGRGTKRAMLRPVQAARTLSTRNLTGITLYRPTELMIRARAGTPLPEIEAALAENNQQIIAEPPDLTAMFGASEAGTLGGAVSANLSGPRRIMWGAMRDHVLGIRAVTGEGEVFRSGGRVLKNVTGLDLCKLLTGAHGTLGVLTEVTLKVLPRAEATGTLAIRVPDAAGGVAALSAALGSPYGVSGAALLIEGHGLLGLEGIIALARIEDFTESVRYRLGRLRTELAAHGEATLLDTAASHAVWRSVRDAEPLGATPEEAIWRISVAPSAAPGVVAALGRAFAAKLMLDWGGGLIWVAGPAREQAHGAVMQAAAAAGGSFTLFRGPASLSAHVPVLPEEAAPLAAIARRVRAALDPLGLLNPGRMRG